MNVKFLNPFVEAAYEVVTAETQGAVTRGDLSLDHGLYVTDDVTVVLSLVGDVKGTVLYSLAQETAIKLASIIMEDEFTQFDELAQSGIAELGNVITGRASMKLSETGCESNISTPSLIIGKGALLSTLDYPRLIVPLVTIAGPLRIHIALREIVNGRE